MKNDIEMLLGRLWNDYAAINPQAGAIHKLLGEQGETVVNDHIALRTFDDPRVNVNALDQAFLRLGYKAAGRYEFPDKKLLARHYEHADATFPRVFISELRLADFTPKLCGVVKGMLDQMPADL